MIDKGNGRYEGLFPYDYQKRPFTALAAMLVGDLIFIIYQIVEGGILAVVIGFAVLLLLLTFVISMGETSAFGSLFPPKEMGSAKEIVRHLPWEKEE
jgi:hypothetical protein